MDEAILKRIQLLNWVLAAGLSAAAWVCFSGGMAGAVLVGGIIAAVSFGWLQRDLRRLFRGPLTAVKSRFFIKYYARLSLLAVLLFWLIRYGRIQTIGLLLGLSVVLLSTAAVMAAEAKRLYFSVKEAS
ncbi:MAG: ATP synthase subunit I [Desulfobacteraceae bacterium]|nr:ATP synthase subunit I [Desulfobacteraceae bacterium]